MRELKVVLSVIITILSFVTSTLSVRESFSNYHQELVFQPSKAYLEAPPVVDYFPADISSGFIKKPGFQLNAAFEQELNLFNSPKLRPPQYLLFTPNRIDQRPETVGQIEEYKKALIEEAEENEKEKENALNTNLDYYSGFNSDAATTKSFVNVRADTYKYNYQV